MTIRIVPLSLALVAALAASQASFAASPAKPADAAQALSAADAAALDAALKGAWRDPKNVTRDVRVRQSEIVAVVQEGLGQVRAVKAFGRQDLEVAHMEAASHASTEAALRARKVVYFESQKGRGAA